MNREEWLHQGYKELGNSVFKLVNVELPDDVKVSCGWASSGGASRNQTTIGQCFARRVSDSKVNEIFISPKLDDPIHVLDVLAHELIHAFDDCKSGHRGQFKRVAVAIGLEGKMTSTHAGEVLKEKLQAIAQKIGEYPHAKLDYTKQLKKQSTRMIKVACNECEFSYRTSQKNIDNMENKTCNCCGEWAMEAC
jgi:hypothetical protein